VIKHLVLAILVFTHFAQAVSLKQAFEAALTKTEGIPLAQSRLGQSQERVSQAWGAMLPSVSLLGSYLKQNSTASAGGVAGAFTLADQFNSRFALTQPVFRGFAEYAAIRSARADRRAQEASLEQARVVLYSSVASAFFGVLTREQDRANLQTLLELTEQRVQDLQARSQIGRSREGEVLTAQAQVAVLKSQMQVARSTLDQARDLFALTTGLARDTLLEVPHAPSLSLSTLGDLGEYLGQIEERPDLKALREQLLASEESVSVARAGHFPSIDFTGNYYLSRTGVQSSVNWDLGVSFVLPLFQGGIVSARVSEALGRKNERELLLAQGRRSAENQIRSAYETVRAGIEQTDALEQAARIGERNYKAQVRDYHHGLVTNLDVLQALNSFQETKRSLDQVRFQTLSAWAGLQSAIGKIF
jgi:outer membrane protein